MKAEREKLDGDGLYQDIIDLPRHVSRVHPPMPLQNRAAQFAPFAALTGFGDVIDEASRLTDMRIDLSPEEREALNARLRALEPRLPAQVTVTYFMPDRRKDGGRYVAEAVELRQILPEAGTLLLADGRRVALADVLEIE